MPPGLPPDIGRRKTKYVVVIIILESLDPVANIKALSLKACVNERLRDRKWKEVIRGDSRF